MDHSARPSQPVMGVGSGAAQIAYVPSTYQPAVIAGAPSVMEAIPTTTQPSTVFPSNSALLPTQHQLVFQQVQQFHHQQQQQQHQHLQVFWANQMLEIEHTNDFKNQNLPLARIKKIMKADEDVRMISAEAPVIFAKACEIFILELTLRAWLNTEENKRRTLQKNDIAAAISRSDIFDFLVDIVPRDELKDEGLGVARTALPAVGASADTIPYYYMPAPTPAPALVPGAGVIIGKAEDQTGVAALYTSQQPHQIAYMWQQPPQNASKTE